MGDTVDVQQLALDRTRLNRSRTARRRHLVARYVVPATVLAGFAAMLGWAVRDRFLPARPVTVLPVVVARAHVHRAGTPLFQAPGWVEPRPTAVLVAALAEGIVEELLVVEGQPVESGQAVARLIDADAGIALQQAQANLQLMEAELAFARAELAAARLRMQRPVHLAALAAEAESALAQSEQELAGLPFQIRAAEARADYAKQEFDGKQAAGSALAGRLVQRAESTLEGVQSELEELRGRRPILQRQIQAMRQRRDALAEQLELKIEESRRLAGAEAKLKEGQARLRQAQLAVQAAQLRLDRMVVRAPVAGRVLQLVASPGSRVMGSSASSSRDATTVVTLYDPKLLQVRADVRLEDVPLVEPGQPVRIETASAKTPIQGEVLLPTSRANIQKNTLEVKVAIKDPLPTIRPEMLVQVTFLAPEPSGDRSEQSQQSKRLLVPRQLVEETPEGTFVWVADPASTARRQKVTLGSGGTASLAAGGTEELIEVVEGLKVTDRLISGGRKGLHDGLRIRITSEDPTLGIADRT